jgi:cobalt-zinc-cadmium efflux system membrane fusion protein
MISRFRIGSFRALALPGLLVLAPSWLGTGCDRNADAEENTPKLHVEPASPRMGFIKLAEVTAEADVSMASATGKVAFNEDVTSRVGSPVSGRVAQLHVQLGDKVKKGQPLITIASPEVEAARAEAIQASADMQLAQRAYDRAERLFADGNIPKKDLQSAEDDLIKAKSNVQRTDARLQLLGVNRETFSPSYVLRAPIDGTVVERAILPGQEVRSDGGTPLITIADLKTLWVLADIYERDLERAEEGSMAEVRVAAYSDVFKGVVKHVGEVVDPNTHTVKVRILVDNTDGRLKPEMFAKVTLSQKKPKTVIAVPSSAVLSDGETNSVIVADAHGNYQVRNIDVGAERDGKVRVLSGLNTGEKIVVQGALFVKNELDNM